jgi:hypothetical protein
MLAALLVLLFATAPAPLPDQNIDGWFQLQPAANPTDPIVVHGWAISRCGSPEIVLRVDGRELAKARPWLEWPGVKERFPGVASAERPGFHTLIDPLHYRPGEHRVSIAASSSECQASRSLGELTFIAGAPPRAWVSLGVIALTLIAFAGIAFALHRWGVRYHRVPLIWVVPPLLGLSIAAIVAAPGGTPLFDPLVHSCRSSRSCSSFWRFFRCRWSWPARS